jgi:hypothetical protein
VGVEVELDVDVDVEVMEEEEDMMGVDSCWVVLVDERYGNQDEE